MDILSNKIKKSMIEDIKDQERWRIWRRMRQEKLVEFIRKTRKKYRKFITSYRINNTNMIE